MEDSIIDELFNARCDDFESGIMKKEKYYNKNLEAITNKFEEVLKILPQDIRDIVSKKLDFIYKKTLDNTTFWCKKYYGFGIKDGVKLKQELRTNFRERKENEEHFLIDYEGDFNDFLENFRVNILYKNEEYDKTLKEWKNVLNEYPRVKDFYENNKFCKFKEEELKAILEIMRLEGIMYGLETREAFYLGIKQQEII